MADQDTATPSGNLGVGGAGSELNRQLSSDSMLQLEDHITMEQFSQLMQAFRHRRRAPLGTSKMPTEHFKALLSHTLNRPEGDERISLLCNKINSEEEGFIHEDEFCSYFLQKLQEKDSLSHTHNLPFQDPPKFRHNMASKETLCQLLYSGPPPRYITISKDGGVGIWNLSLHFKHGFVLEGGLAAKGKPGSTLWVTDCALLQDCNKLVLSTTSRELLFYDVFTTIFTCQYQVHDLPSIVLCMAYHSGSQSAESGPSPSYLLYGDMSGSVYVFTFSNPQAGLFEGSSMDEEASPQMIAFSRLTEHAQLVTVQCIPQLHPEWVRRISYVWHNHSFISCSNSPSSSLVIRDVGKKRKSYVFSVRKGVLCFDYCHRLELLVTGSIDHIVRFWNPYVPSKPMAVLTCHSAAVLDVVISVTSGLVYSYSHDAVLCAWDIYEHVLVQKINIRFPFSQRLPDYGPSVLNLFTNSPNLQTFVVLCNDYVAELKVGTTPTGLRGKGGGVFTSHTHPVSAAVYNPHFHQVVSACEGGVVTLWDVDNGHEVLRLTNCHGNHEITALSLDATGRRLITGSRAGDIKVWNYINGTCLKHMKGSSYSEVTGVMHILERGKFLSVGWNRRITIFPDEPDIFDVKPDSCWKGEESHHQDDILCVSYCSPYYLATGSFDGVIKVWNLDTEKMVSRFHSTTKMRPATLSRMRLAPKSRCSSIRSSFNSLSSRPASRRMSSYRIKSSSLHFQHVPVDQLQLLRSRFRSYQKGSATLVSSEGGVARFWDIFNSQDPEPLGCFAMTERENENVMTMKTDPRDHYLLAGDTTGSIAIFDISNYCIKPHKNQKTKDSLRPMARWQAHSREVLSIDYVSNETQPLVVSASGDCTVRLWTLAGHYVGMFGQKQPWKLRNPSTYEHPNTPWGEIQRPSSHLSVIGQDMTTLAPQAPSRSATPRSDTGGKNQVPMLQEEESPGAANQNAASLTSSTSSLSNTTSLAPPLTDKSLGCNYDNGIHKRMADRQERRTQYADINTKATQRFGSLCSPFQALQLLNVEDVKVPQEVVTVVHRVDY